MVVASWYLILYCKVNNEFFFPSALLNLCGSSFTSVNGGSHMARYFIGYVKREKTSDLCKIWDESPTDGGWHLGPPHLGFEGTLNWNTSMGSHCFTCMCNVP
jgi:hypothetical protein